MKNLCLIFHHLDRKIAFIGTLILIPIILYFLLSNKLLYGLASFFLLVSCLFWLFMGKNPELLYNISFVSRSKEKFKITIILYYLLLSILMLSLYLRDLQYERPLPFFLCLILVAITLGFQILYCPNSPYMIAFVIFNIVLAGIMASWPQLMIFPSLVGVDPFEHKIFVESIISTGHIPSGSAYSSIPLFHILISTTYCLLNLYYKFATTLSVSLAQIIVDTLFVYLLGNLVFKDHRVCLLASLILMFGNYHVLRTFWSIPNSFAMVYILVGLFLIIRLRWRVRFESIFLVLMIFIALILTHSLAALAMAIILITISGTMYFYNILVSDARASMNVYLLSLFYATLLFAWWTYGSIFTRKLGYLIKKGFSVDFDIPTNVINHTQNLPIFELILPYLPEFIFFSLAIVGAFYAMHYKNALGIAFALSGIIIIFISFVSPLLGAFIIPDRWRYMGQCILAIFTSIAIILLSNTRYSSKGLFALILGLIVFFMVISPVANLDNFMFIPNSGHRYALIESEIVALGTSSNIWQGEIGTDEYFAAVKTQEYDPRDISQELIFGNFSRDNGRLVLVRNEIINKPLWASRSIYCLNYDPNTKISSEGFCKIYNSNSVNGYCLA